MIAKKTGVSYDEVRNQPGAKEKLVKLLDSYLMGEMSGPEYKARVTAYIEKFK